MTNVYEKINVDVSEEETIALPQVADDLTKIKGIGSGTAEKLKVRKIYTYRQLAEITPEKLSEAPGIGIATARKFIEEAKKLLEGIQEIVETGVEEDFERKEVIQQRSVTPYEQLLARSDDQIENAVHGPEEIETETEIETENDNIESFEVADVIVEEELPQETVQKKWFKDKFNYSRLSATHPPHPSNIERSSKESKLEIEKIEKIEEYQEEIPEQFENSATVEPFESEVLVPEEEIPREETIVTPINIELPEVTKIPEISEDINIPVILEDVVIPEVSVDTHIPEVSEASTSSRTLSRQEDLTSEIAESLKDLGYYPIPSAIKALKPFFQDIDYLGCKLVSVNDNSNLIFLVPIKFCELEGRILIYEEKIDYKPHSKAQESNSIHTARHYIDELLKARNAVFEDVVNGDNFQDFFQKYLQVRFTAEKSARNKKLYFVSGQTQTQYKVLVEPILLTKIPAKCMEKSILFPYQRKTNLHVIDRSNIATLLRFLEKKYKLIESRFKRTNSIEIYQNADTRYRSSLRVASLPFIGYAVVLLVIYFSRLYFLLRLFNSIGFAVMGVYFFTIAYFYFKFYKTKKELTTEFETPYYLQNAQFNEIDLLCVKEEFTGEQMAQFGYECFGKDNNFKVLEQIEKDTIKKSVVAKQQEQVTPQLYELDSESDSSSTTEKDKNEVKYSSFFDD